MARLILRTDNGDFDLYDNETIVQTISSFDFADITTRTGEYTNTFKLPKTSNNIRLIGYATEINASSTFVYSKINVTVIIDDEPFKNGFFVINGIDKDISVNFYSGNSIFYNEIKNKYLNTLDWSDYDHVWNYTNAVANSSNSTGYVYPLINYNGQNLASDTVDVRKILPATYFKEILNRLISEAGYTPYYDFDTVDLDRSLIPYSQKNPVISSETILLNQVDVGNVTDTGLLVESYNATWGEVVLTDVTRNIELDFNVINTSGSSTLYNDSTKIFTCNFDGTYNYDILCKFVSNDFSTVTYSDTVGYSGAVVYADLVVSKIVGGIETILSQTRLIEVFNYYVPAVTLTTDTPTLTFVNDTSTGSVYLNSGESVHAYVLYRFVAPASGTVTYTNVNLTITPELDATSYLKIDLQPEITFGNLFTYNSMLPKIKCSDFLRDLCIRFGLIISVNDYTKTVSFKKFSNIKDNIVNAVDWSDKLDLSSGYRISFKYDNYAQTNNIKHVDDKTVTNTPLGTDYQLLIDNSNLEKEKDLYISPFAASELNTNSAVSIDYAYINLYDTTSGKFNRDCKPKILFSDSVNGLIKFTDGTTTSGFINTKRTWFIDFEKPNDSVGFGINTITKNSLDLFNVLANLKVLECYVYLNNLDVRNYDLFTPVYIEYFQSYFICTKIEQYDYINPRLTKVELIKLN